MQQQAKRRDFVLPLLGLAALCLIWGTQFLVIKVAQRDIPPLLGTAVRFSALALIAHLAVSAMSARAPVGMRIGRLTFAGSQAICMCLLHWGQGRIDSALAVPAVAGDCIRL